MWRGEVKKINYTVKNGVLYKVVENREVLVETDSMPVEVCKKVHLVGHFEIANTEDLIKRDFFFPNIRKNSRKCRTQLRRLYFD